MDSSKLEILKTLYSQQQSTAHILRDRMSKISTGVVSTLIAVDGWMIASGEKLTDPQTSMLGRI